MLDLWNNFRAEMPVTRDWAFLNHAACAPLPERARQAVLRWVNEAAEQGSVAWLRWSARMEVARRLAAELIHADPAEIALVRSTTEGINLVAEGLDWQKGDNVVTLADEFPSNQYPWLNQAWRGVEVRRVPTENGRVDIDQIAAACDDRTRIVSVSWVGYLSGWRNDLSKIADIAHQRGAMLFVDAIQGLGVFPLDVRAVPIDFLAADGHKWLLGPEGAGIFYCRQANLQRLRPIGVGYNSVPHATDYARIEWTPKPNAARYEGGAPNLVGFIALTESLELLAGYESEAIGNRVLEITDYACERLRSIDAILQSYRDAPRHNSGIVSFEVPGVDPEELRQACLKQGIVLSRRSGRIRISPHAYNQAAEIDHLIEVILTSRRAPESIS